MRMELGGLHTHCVVARACILGKALHWSRTLKQLVGSSKPLHLQINLEKSSVSIGPLIGDCLIRESSSFGPV